MSEEATTRLQIGELSRRTGVRADTLRAWERRYGLLTPARSEGGFRLYGPDDERRVRTMLSLLESGLSAAEAARAALREGDGATPAGPSDLASLPPRLLLAFDRFDDLAANRLLDEVVAGLSIEGLIAGVVLPVMREVGERWQRGELSVAAEHFATNLVRGRLLGLGRNWGSGAGPVAVLACPPGELHDLGLICFGLLLREQGWRIAYLGPDTPIETMAAAADRLAADAAVVAAADAVRLAENSDELGALARKVPVHIGGAGAERAVADAVFAQLLPADPIQAAASVGAGARGRGGRPRG
jgi:MerR family transcriptional regulator, light-induced transcriptional regulator